MKREEPRWRRRALVDALSERRLEGRLTNMIVFLFRISSCQGILKEKEKSANPGGTHSSEEASAETWGGPGMSDFSENISFYENLVGGCCE